MAAIQGSVVLALFAFAWIHALRMRVSRQTRLIEEEMNKRGQLSARYDELVSNADELIFTLDRDGVFVAANPATDRVFSSVDGGLVGRGIWPSLTAESRKRLREAMQALNPAEANVTIELNADVPNGRLTLEAGLRVQTKSGTRDEFQCIARDVSERRRLESQILHMQKMESVGQLAAGAAHDYNNLMTVVLANAEFLRESDVLSGEDAENLEDIHDAAQRAAKVTDQLLAFSRRQVMQPECVKPDTLLDGIAAMLRRLIGETIAFKLDVPEGLPNVRVDRGMIEQAVVNLVLNARDAMPDGGSLSVMARHESISQSEAERRLEALPGEYLRISVADTGSGIPKESLAHVFEPFYTTKETGKGTGLGLSTVFGITKQHDGWVEVESVSGIGTSFHLFLPTTLDEASPETEPASLQSDAPAPHSETALLVEDEPAVRGAMVKALERAGYRALEAADGREVIEVWNGSEEPIDFLITEMVMPGGMSGRDIAREIRKTHPDLLVIYCTGYSPDLTGLSSLTENERLLPKPFESKMLFQLIRELLGKQREIAPKAV